ncbi:tRNA pseudouridine(55) synthase TruB [Entomospira entomophila]|uniref:tRNA pseudouridine synthase B n=1 Tax=Entomospira entomophila TaxID=2719988 RepID=A0A968KTU3_9SPIO|nr:tRNA pseudouridine(55) synthase TruB [Entomospira entomophilus]NIZ40711.1 tRNA pseudouridine(55) synthase TruB [Entomospira entomophilus]WDI34924.1 tRNA pseudouridine(55) synthase TruB [Entomospira entomophilus]
MSEPTPHGILLWNKPAGVTSFGALNPIKRALGKQIKVGHAGTLDQAAEGLQIVLIGAMTKLNPIFSHLDKEYIAVITFGYETSTLDREGAIINHAPLPSLERLLQSIETFPRGVIKQVPPLYSAIHVNGKRAYQYAQQGIDLEMKERTVSLYDIHVVSMKETDQQTVESVTISIRCGGGFYVRSFARDLAYACESIATMTALERVGIGYHQANHWAFQLAQSYNTIEDIRTKILSPLQALQALGTSHVATVREESIIAVKRGNPFQIDYLTGENQSLILQDHEPLFLFGPAGELLAQIYREHQRWYYQFVVHHP